MSLLAGTSVGIAGERTPRVTDHEECWPVDPAAHAAIQAHFKDGKALRGLKLATQIRHALPEYPKEAVKQGIVGVIVVKGTVDARTGEPNDLVATEAPEILSEAALKAVRQWRYKTFEIDKVKYDMNFKTEITFALK